MEVSPTLSKAIRAEVEAQMAITVSDLRQELRALRAELAKAQRSSEGPLMVTKPVDFGDDPGGGSIGVSAELSSSPLLWEDAGVDPIETAISPDEESERGSKEPTTELPETLFSYCIALLVVEPANCARPIAYLACQYSMQLILLNGLWCATNISLIETRFHSQSHRASQEQCMFGNKLFDGVPFQDIAGCAVSIVLAAVVLMADDKELLSSVYPGERAAWHIHAIVNFAWCMQAMVIPLMVLMVTPNLLISSTNNIDVVLNGLAVTFIVDIDNLMYGGLVSFAQGQELKAKLASIPLAYQRTLNTSAHKHVDANAQYLCVAKAFLMLTAYAQSFAMSSIRGIAYVKDLFAFGRHTDVDAISALCVLSAFGIAATHSAAWNWRQSPRDSRLWSFLIVVARSGVNTVLSFALVVLTLHLHGFLLGFDVADLALWERCFWPDGQRVV